MWVFTHPECHCALLTLCHVSTVDACGSCSCFFKLLSSSTRLCTARLLQSASGSPSATSVDSNIIIISSSIDNLQPVKRKLWPLWPVSLSSEFYSHWDKKKRKKEKPIKSRTPLYYRTSWFLISFPEMSSPAVNDCALSFCVFVKTDCWQLSGAGVASGFFFSVIKMSHHIFFNTCQPRPGLKQLITDVHQQVLTGHAQKHRANSEEDASSHHPLTHRIQVRWQQRSTDIILCYTTETNRDNESHILVSMVPHCPHKVQQSAAHLCGYLKQNNRGIVKQIQHL